MAKPRTHRAGLPTVVLVLLLSTLTSMVRPASAGATAATSTAVTIDGTQPGRTFDGIGAIGPTPTGTSGPILPLQRFHADDTRPWGLAPTERCHRRPRP